MQNIEAKKALKENFPYFLFPSSKEEYSNLINEITLSREEMDLLGYDRYLSAEEERMSRDLPFEYNVFKDHGGFFRTYSLLKNTTSILNKLNMLPDLNQYSLYVKKRDPKEFLFQYGEETDGDSFDFLQAEKERCDQMAGARHGSKCLPKDRILFRS